MENKRTYITDFYQVKIGERIGTITVEYFENSELYLCKFQNDKQSDFINTYNSQGFIVDMTGTTPKIKTEGSFTFGDALKVWEQIESAERPLASRTITI